MRLSSALKLKLDGPDRNVANDHLGSAFEAVSLRRVPERAGGNQDAAEAIKAHARGSKPSRR